jgi:hypothetical protein
LVDKYALWEYQARFDLASGDYVYVGATINGFGFLPLYSLTFDGRLSGSSGGLFEHHINDISPFGDLSNDISLGFQLSSDDSSEEDGVYIDDVILKTRDFLITGYSYSYYMGTSMAAPHVSGLAGLILAYYPGIALNELKSRILNGVDVIPSLNGKVLTGGRINAYKSLGIPVGPTNLTAMRLSPTQIDLNWSDNSHPAFNEDGFSIERKKGVSGNYEEIATIGQDETAYSDALSELGTYYYRIMAYSSLGNSSYSNEATPLVLDEGSDGGCFIATAAFGSSLERHVQMLRNFRDTYLVPNSIGRALVALYYEFSPPIAGFIGKNGVLRGAVRIGLHPVAGLTCIPSHCSHARNIVLFLGILAAAGSIILIIATKKPAVLVNKVFAAHRANYPKR